MNFGQRVDAIARFSNAPYMQFLKRSGIEIDVVSAKNAMISDTAGRHYIDCIAGYGNCVLGHNPRPVVDAVVSELQSSRPFNLPFVHEVQALLAERLAQDSPGELECSFVVNSGSEAVETALKLSRLVTGKPGIVCTVGAWHGFTFGCLSVSEQSMCRQFRPMLDGIKRVAYGNAAAIEASIDDTIGCVIVEPIQAESGAVVPPQGYLKSLREVCTNKNVLLIFDEVKTGIAKTGRMFACEHDGVVPDVLVCGKALGGGVMPIGAVVARRNVWGRFGLSFPMSSSSGAGNAYACAAALATLKMVADEKHCERAERLGERLMAGLKAIQKSFPDRLLETSGRGLLIGLKFEDHKFASQMVVECARRSVLVMNAFCDRSKILVEPPVCITDEQADRVVAVISESLSDSTEG
jgi:putrescine aminotransferase